jgi:predicted O-linked N-acetylglucosamine transferase (SPINDLY family)
LTERVARLNPSARERMRFLKWIPHPEFFSLARLADAFLDPILFGGGRTCLELWAYGVPIVTWPGPFLRGRIAYGGYRQMGHTDLVARDPTHYVDLCLELAKDKAKRARMGAEIAEAAGALYEDKAAVREIERFFLAAIEAARRGEKLAGWPA